MHNTYVVSSVRTSHARIINPLGEELAHTGPRLPFVSMTIDLDYMVCHHDFHHGLVEEMLRLYGDRITIRFLNEEGQFLLQSNDDALPLAKLVDEFGLVSRRQYAAHHRHAYPALRDGRRPDPQHPNFAGRQPYTPVTVDQWEKIRREQGADR